MSKTRSERQTGIENHARAQVGPAEANARRPGSRSLQAGGEFLKALGSDVGAVASRLRLQPPRPSAPRRISWGSVLGRVFRFVTIALVGLGSITALAIFGFALWMLYPAPVEPRRSGADTPGLQSEARKSESVKHVGPLKVGETSRQGFGHEAGTQGRPGPDATVPSIAPLGESGSSSADAAEREAAIRKRQAAAGTGADQRQLVGTETQDGRTASHQQEMARSLIDSSPRMQCNVDLCRARYASFQAADCTYQPHGGGPRRVCELSTRSTDAPSQTSLASTGPRSETEDTRVAERAAEVPKSALPARAGAQCNVDLCSAKYSSFRAADCTYQPLGGGSRRICEPSTRSADAPSQTSPAATGPRSETEDTRVAEKAVEAPKPATSARAGAQCNVDLCAASYASFRAADCTYQPHGGEPRRICER
jgi:hypothetical protein